MKINGTDITIVRGESFTLDFSFVNKDGSPFIISNELPHPYLLISVASNTFNTDNAYKYNVWCDATPYYRFKSTVAIEIPNTQSFDAITYPNKGVDVAGREYCNDCVFKCTSDGKYYVYKYDSSAGAGDAGYYVYNMRLVYVFDSEVTKAWSSQNYYYKIALVNTEIEVEEGDEEVNTTFTVPLLTQSVIYVVSNIGGVN